MMENAERSDEMADLGRYKAELIDRYKRKNGKGDHVSMGAPFRVRYKSTMDRISENITELLNIQGCGVEPIDQVTRNIRAWRAAAKTVSTRVQKVLGYDTDRKKVRPVSLEEFEKELHGDELEARESHGDIHSWSQRDWLKDMGELTDVTDMLDSTYQGCSTEMVTLRK
jgi:hypothetical protein